MTNLNEVAFTLPTPALYFLCASHGLTALTASGFSCSETSFRFPALFPGADFLAGRLTFSGCWLDRRLSFSFDTSDSAPCCCFCCFCFRMSAIFSRKERGAVVLAVALADWVGASVAAVVVVVVVAVVGSAVLDPC